MSFWKNLFSWNHESGLADPLPMTEQMHTTEINPATALPMIGEGCGGIDVGGNPYGTDLHSMSEADTITNMSLDNNGFGDCGF